MVPLPLFSGAIHDILTNWYMQCISIISILSFSSKHEENTLLKGRWKLVCIDHKLLGANSRMYKDPETVADQMLTSICWGPDKISHRSCQPVEGTIIDQFIRTIQKHVVCCIPVSDHNMSSSQEVIIKWLCPRSRYTVKSDANWISVVA